MHIDITYFGLIISLCLLNIKIPIIQIPSDTIKFKEVEIKEHRVKKIYGSKKYVKNVTCPLKNSNCSKPSVIGLKLPRKKRENVKLLSLNFYSVTKTHLIDSILLSVFVNQKENLLISKSNIVINKGWNKIDFKNEDLFIDCSGFLLIYFNTNNSVVELAGTLLPKGNLLYDCDKQEFYEFKFATAAIYIETLEWA